MLRKARHTRTHIYTHVESCDEGERNEPLARIMDVAKFGKCSRCRVVEILSDDTFQRLNRRCVSMSFPSPIFPPGHFGI